MVTSDELSLRSRITELEAKLAQEQSHRHHLEDTVETLRTSTSALLNTFEQSQEGISNRLIREVSRLKGIQLDMCNEVEAHEAKLVAVLEERLQTLRTQKVELENALECEQERIVNRLQRHIEELRISASQERSPVSLEGNLTPSPRLELPEQINLAVTQHIEREAALKRQIVKLQEENQQLLVENMRLQNKVRRQSIEDSPILEPLSPVLKGGRRSGSITELHLAGLKKSGQVPSDSDH
ncbi:hypothetical protein PSACC_03238 [Paramicrosporidium saccamoebae]|uniref:Uncharacterized protein n=1 Tax=Paramicrosporidium saccamoebae TaxID=1246581 RepID=A0A2H9TGU2_9FUNG|nr:hypothetical protein PSACC_03238 [Paramicrosporidium saccamoebae]